MDITFYALGLWFEAVVHMEGDELYFDELRCFDCDAMFLLDSTECGRLYDTAYNAYRDAARLEAMIDGEAL